MLEQQTIDHVEHAALRVGFQLVFVGTKANMVKGFMADPASELVIFGPTPELMALPNMPDIKVGSLKLTKKVTRNIVFSFDTPTGTGGRFFGLGHKNSKAKKAEQWWRMDWHRIGPPTIHPNPTPQQELANAYWKSGNYHHHITK